MSSEVSTKFAADISRLAQGGGIVSIDTRDSFSSQNNRISQADKSAGTALGKSTGSTATATEASDTKGNAGTDGQVSNEELMQAVAEMNQHFQNVQRNIHFSVDDETGTTVVKVIEAETEEVIRQIPSEEIVALSKYLEESAGRIIRAEA